MVSEKIRSSVGMGVISCAVLVLFAVAYSYLATASIHAGLKFSSPDETANYFFSRQFALEGRIGYEEPLLAASNGYLHPRSMTVAGPLVVPVSFLGLVILYGTIAKALGITVLPFITPVLAVCTVPFFYILVRSVFSRPVARLSVILLLMHPAYWYFAARSLMPNVLFVDLLIIGFALLLLAYRVRPQLPRPFHILTSSTALHAYAGLCIGLALTVRLSEVVWVAGILILLTLFFVRTLRLHTVGAFIGGCAAALSVLFIYNVAVYGNPLVFGYQTLDSVAGGAALDRTVALISDQAPLATIATSLLAVAEPFAKYLLPFGYHPVAIVQNVMNYIIQMFWWYTLPAFFGFLLCVRYGIRQLRQLGHAPLLVYLIISTLVFVWLGMYYGSWAVRDNIAEEVSIGSSHVRYWLPLYILMIPLAATAFSWLAQRTSIVGRAGVFVGLAILVLLSVQITLWQTTDSLFPTAHHIREYGERSRIVASLTESDAVIFSERSDKIFFPERKVAEVVSDFGELELVPQLRSFAPVYYYGFWSGPVVPFVNEKFFSRHGLALELVSRIAEGEYLYRVVAR